MSSIRRFRGQDAPVTDIDLLASLRSALAARAEAPRTAPVRMHNRLMTVIDRECDRLATSAEGRSALTTAAATDPDPMLRLVAATTIQRWDTPRARAALENLVELSGGAIVRPMTMRAALGVSSEPGRTAALCLLNLDSPKPLREVRPPARMSQGKVGSDLLDAAESVYNLAMNGGLEHAYEVAGEQFAAAAQACDAVGAAEHAGLLRAVLALLPTKHDPVTREGRAVALRRLTSEQDRELATLNARLYAADDLMQRLEIAAEA